MVVPLRLSFAPLGGPSRAALHYLRRRRIVAAGLGTSLARPLAAQGPWPNRPLRIVVGYPAGGGVDLGARMLAQTLSAMLGQSVQVENRTGANGSLAMESVVRAGDNYSLLYGNTGSVANRIDCRNAVLLRLR